MTDYIIHGSTLTGIANAIRTKNPDVTGLVDPVDMAQDILDISGGGGEPYIPDERLLMHTDFTQSNIDIQTGIQEYSGNCTYDSTNKYLYMNYNDHRGYANFNYILNQDVNYNYKLEIELGDVTEGTRATDKYLFALYSNPNSQSGAELRLYWNNTSSCWALHHSSGRDTYSTETDVHCFDNVKTTLTFEKRSGSTTYDIYIQSPNFNNGTKKLLHDISGNWMTRYLRIGAQGSNNGFENIVVKSVKSTQIVLNPSQSIVEPITITANGTYTADGNTYIGFNPVVVNVPERSLYKWDFTKSSNKNIDEVRGYTGNISGATSLSSNGIATDGMTRFDPLVTPNDVFINGFKTRFKVKFGEFYSSSHSSGEKGRIFSFGTNMALYWNDVPMLYGSGVGGAYRLTSLDNQFDLLEDDELIVEFYKSGNDYKAKWTFPDGTVVDYGTVSISDSIILGEYQYTDNGLGGVYIKGFEIDLIPIQVT